MCLKAWACKNLSSLQRQSWARGSFQAGAPASVPISWTVNPHSCEADICFCVVILDVYYPLPDLDISPSSRKSLKCLLISKPFKAVFKDLQNWTESLLYWSRFLFTPFTRLILLLFLTAKNVETLSLVFWVVKTQLFKAWCGSPRRLTLHFLNKYFRLKGKTTGQECAIWKDMDNEKHSYFLKSAA